jgi:hypothetical protein
MFYEHAIDLMWREHAIVMRRCYKCMHERYSWLWLRSEFEFAFFSGHNIFIRILPPSFLASNPYATSCFLLHTFLMRCPYAISYLFGRYAICEISLRKFMLFFCIIVLWGISCFLARYEISLWDFTLFGSYEISLELFVRFAPDEIFLQNFKLFAS